MGSFGKKIMKSGIDPTSQILGLNTTNIQHPQSTIRAIEDKSPLLKSIARKDPIVGLAGGNFKSPSGTLNEDPNADANANKITLQRPDTITPQSMSPAEISAQNQAYATTTSPIAQSVGEQAAASGHEFLPNQNAYAGLYDEYSGSGALSDLRDQRSPETQSLIASAMDQAKGLSAEENMAIRQNALSSINSQNQTALHQLRGTQAANGVRGGVAQAQLAGQQGAATDALSTAERNLVSDNIKYKQSGLTNAAQIVGNQENAERDQAADKLNSILTLRGQDLSLDGAYAQAQAAANAGGGGGGKGGGK